MDEAIYVCLDCHEEFLEPHENCPACGEEMSPNAKVPLDARYAVFMLRTECSRCGQSMPLNGPQREVTCGACHNVSHFPPDRWKSLLEDFTDEYEDFGWADSRSSTVMTGGGTFELQYGKQVPHCPKCHKTLASFDIEPGTDEILVCPNPECEAKVPTFPAPDWLQEVLPTAMQLYGADREEGEAPAGAVEAEGAEAARPVVMQCPQCGGALKITGASERLVPCEYCEVDVYLPDDVWLRMNPVKTSDRWMLRFSGPARVGGAAQTEEVDSFFGDDDSSEPDGAPPPEPTTAASKDASSREPTQRRAIAMRIVFVAAAAAGLVYLLLNWHN